MVTVFSTCFRIREYASGAICLVLAVWLAICLSTLALAETDEALRSRLQRPAIIPFPADNPYTPTKAALGESLFFDNRLSRSGRMSCARCHDPDFGLEDGLPIAEGELGLPGDRNTPTLWNIAWVKDLFRDGREPSLERQVLNPITAEREMNFTMAGVIERLAADPDMVAAFAEAFPNNPAISQDTVLAALATYERTLIAPQSRFDRWIEGDEGALTEAERRGLRLFYGQAGCAACHSGWLMSDGRFHVSDHRTEDPGRYSATGNTADLHAFRTPGLRDIANRAPHMHDGELKTLGDVLGIHGAGPSLDAAERGDLIAFLGALGPDGPDSLDRALSGRLPAGMRPKHAQ